MRTRSTNHILRRDLLWAMLLALLCAGVAVGAVGTSSAALRADGTLAGPEPGAQVPNGGDCWTEIDVQNVLTGGNYVMGMDSDPETGNILAGGYYTGTGIGEGAQLVEYQSGSSFQIVPNPADIGTQSVINGVGSIPSTDNEFWLVGNSFVTTATLPLIERFDGTSLTHVQNPDVHPLSFLKDVDAASPDFAIAVGRELYGPEKPLIEEWDGSDWTSVPPPNSEVSSLTGVVAFPDGRAVAVGQVNSPETYQLVLSRSTSGVWSEVSAQLPGSFAQLTAVDASGPTDVWAVGYYINASNNRVPYSLHGNLDTATWTVVSMPIPTGAGVSSQPSTNGDTQANTINCPSPSQCFAAGGTTDGAVDKTTAWERLRDEWNTLPDPANSFLVAFVALSWYGNGSPKGMPGDATQLYGAGNYIDSTSGLSRVGVLSYDTSCGEPEPTPTPGGPTSTPVGATPTPALPTATATPIACTPGQFSDVPSGSTFYPFITCLVNRNVISGYSDCTFRPGNNVTRGQLAKVVSNAANFQEPETGQTFEDIPVGSTYHDFIERLFARGIIGGYPCGGAGEPCVGPGNRPYFRPNANSTRGQISKIVAIAAGYQDPTSSQTFEDVPGGSTFHLWIENLASRGIMSGYACGGAGEPCVGPGNRPYFRPANNATRGQTSKIVANTFFPSCNP